MRLIDPPAARGTTRAMPQGLLWAAAVLLGARLILAAWAPAPAPARWVPPSSTAGATVTSPVRDLVIWQTPVAGPALARASRKPLLYEFTADWCPPCKRLAAEVFGSPEHAKLINERFVPVRVLDRSREAGKNPPDVEALQKRFGIDSFPTLVVTTPDGKEIARTSGYGDAGAIRQFLEAAARMSAGGR